jgi:hypothetical protein
MTNKSSRRQSTKRRKRPGGMVSLRRHIPEFAIVYCLALALVVGGLALNLWWPSRSEETSGRAGRLTLDRSEVDLGTFRLGALARAAFTLSNTGDGPLRIVEVPTVKALKGC